MSDLEGGGVSFNPTEPSAALPSSTIGAQMHKRSRKSPAYLDFHRSRRKSAHNAMTIHPPKINISLPEKHPQGVSVVMGGSHCVSGRGGDIAVKSGG